MKGRAWLSDNKFAPPSIVGMATVTSETVDRANAVQGSVRFTLGPWFGGLDVSNLRFKLNELLSVQLSVQTDVLVREVV